MPDNFDPFEKRRSFAHSVLAEIERYEIYNIIQSYHGNYDLFAELLQNAVDAVEARWRQRQSGYVPPI